MNYDTAQLRNKMIVAFSLQELKNDIIFDYFPYDLYVDIEGLVSSRDVVQHLLVYCKRNGEFPKLIRLLKEQRPKVFSDELDEQEIVEELEDALLLRKNGLESEFSDVTTQANELYQVIQLLYVDGERVQKEIDNLKLRSDVMAEVIIPLYDSLLEIQLRIDSLIATREEFKRNARRLQGEITEVEKQLVIVRKLMNIS
jgi:uncharacterized coiled-coil DUF342 family protein